MDAALPSDALENPCAAERSIAGTGAKLPDRESLQRFVEALVEVSTVPGVCIALRSRSEGYTLAVGRKAIDDSEPITRDTRFAIGCLGKTLLCIVALRLADTGDLDSDAPIGAYLRELAHTAKGDRIRVRHLMCHATGYAGFGVFDQHTAALSWDDLVERVRRAPELFEPGTVFDYEQSAGALLAEIVSRVAARPSLECIEELLEPLSKPRDRRGPRAIGHSVDRAARAFKRSSGDRRVSAIWQASISGRTASVEDLGTLAVLLTTGSVPWLPAGAPRLSSEIVRLLAQRSLRLPETIGGDLCHCLPIGQGLGLSEYRDGIVGRDGTGDGEVVGFRVSPDLGVSCAVGVNAEAGHVRWKVMDAVFAELGFVAARCARSRPLDLAQAELDGRYVGSSLEASVATNGTKVCVSVQLPGGRPAKLAAAIDDEGCLIATSPQRGSGFTFFRDPASGVPCVMVGLCALKKQSDSVARKTAVSIPSSSTE